MKESRIIKAKGVEMNTSTLLVVFCTIFHVIKYENYNNLVFVCHKIILWERQIIKSKYNRNGVFYIISFISNTNKGKLLTNPCIIVSVFIIYKFEKDTLIISNKYISLASILSADQIMQYGLTLIADYINYLGKDTID